MKKITILLFVIILGLCLAACQGDVKESQSVKAASETHVVTDMIGRRVEIPKKISKAYSTGQPGVVALYTINPDMLLGWCIKPAKEEADYIDSKYLGLPVLGLMQGSNDTANREEIMLRSPDIIIMMTYINDSTATDADELQERMGIPVVFLDCALNKIPDAYRFLGDVLDQSERTEILASYSEDVLKNAEEIAKNMGDKERISVYYAQGSKGLQTAPKGSSHSEVIDLVGGENVVVLSADADVRLTVNMEQILSWNPDVIIASYNMSNGTVKGNDNILSIIGNGHEAWSLVSAVQNNMFFSTPCYPYNWLDLPPSVNRIIGVLWMGNLLYPDDFDLDIKEETREFYKLFYNKVLTDDELSALLVGSENNN